MRDHYKVNFSNRNIMIWWIGILVFFVVVVLGGTILMVKTLGTGNSHDDAAAAFVDVQKLRNDQSLNFVTQCSSGGSGDRRESAVYCACVTTMADEISDGFASPIAQSDADSIVSQCLQVTTVWAKWNESRKQPRPLPELEAQ